MWNKIGLSTTTSSNPNSASKMPPRPQRPPQLTKYKRIKPFDQTKQRQRQQRRSNEKSMGKRSESGHSRESSEVSRSYEKRTSMKSFSKVEDLSFKDEELSPIRKRKGEEGEGEGFVERGIIINRVDSESKLQTINDKKTINQEKQQIATFSILVQRISHDDTLPHPIIHPSSTQLLQLISKHKILITDLQSQLKHSLLETQKLRSLLLTTTKQITLLKHISSQLLFQFHTFTQFVPQMMNKISKVMESFTIRQATSSYTTPSKHMIIRRQNSSTFREKSIDMKDMCVRCREIKGKEKSPSQLMENILRTIGEVRMEIGGGKGKVGVGSGEIKGEVDMWTRETRG